MSERKIYAWDIETFKNTFSAVFKEVGTKNYIDFIIHEDDTLNHAEELWKFLYTKPQLVGYNSLNFDGQVIEEIWRKNMYDGRKIFEFAQKVIGTKDSFKLPYKQWTFTHKHLDLMTMNNFGIFGKPTSLKWLEFTTRQQSIQDLPYHFETELDESHFDDLIKYNRKDVDMTDEFYHLCRGMLDMRNLLIKKYDDQIILNQPNSSIGEKIVLYSYCDHTGQVPKEVKKRSTKRTKIVVKDIILPYIDFKLPLFKQVKSDFDDLVLKADKSGVIKLKGVYEKEIDFQDMKVKYALGGIHGCVPSGIYRSTDTHVIKTYDVTSMYPNLAISNKFYPEHLGPEFCDVYGNILEERKKYPKSTDLEMNLAYKEAANSVYGKSNSKYNGFLKDPRYTVQTTINGQLVLSMLGERLAEIGEFIMWNTDGSEILIPRDKEEEYQRICDEWCKLTGIDLEHDEYETMWVRDVNNYIAKHFDKTDEETGEVKIGKVKRKGMFMVYKDYINNWSKNPSALIIPEAINAYFIEGKDPEETVSTWNNIHDFLYGIKGGRNFEYWTVEVDADRAIQNINKHTERAIRYYCSTDGDNILKHWVGGKKLGDVPSAVPNTKGQKVRMLMRIPDRKGEVFRKKRINGETKIVSRYPDLDYQYYVSEAWRWINMLENGETNVEELTPSQPVASTLNQEPEETLDLELAPFEEYVMDKSLSDKDVAEKIIGDIDL